MSSLKKLVVPVLLTIAAAIAPRILAHVDSAPVRAWLDGRVSPPRSTIAIQPLANRTAEARP